MLYIFLVTGLAYFIHISGGTDEICHAHFWWHCFMSYTFLMAGVGYVNVIYTSGGYAIHISGGSCGICVRHISGGSQGHSQTVNLRWARDEHFVIFPHSSIIFSHFSSIFPHFTSSIWFSGWAVRPTGKALTTPLMAVFGYVIHC